MSFPSNGEIMYVKGMGVSISGSESDGNVWDDSKLREAYEKAMEKANIAIAKEIAMSTNKKPSDKDKKNEAMPPPSNNNGRSKEARVKWTVGTPCRAVYADDGVEYEAIVTSMDGRKNCTVTFLGYGNKQSVNVKSLKKSLGEAERTRQVYEAQQEDNMDETGHNEHMNCSDGASSSSHHKKSKEHKRRHKKSTPRIEFPQLPNFAHLPSMELPILPPMPFPTESRPGREAEDRALSSTLISWYLSGYYTGLYQGMKR